MAFHKVIGIDLGTTYSAVSVWDGRDVVIIPSALGAKTVPSVVGLDPEGKVIVGSPAQNNLVSDPANTIIEVKREMGTYERDPDPQTNDPGAPTRKRFRGREYLPQEISAFILMELKRQAESYIGEPIHDAVITVPAYFKEPQKGATEDAAHMARLNVCQLLNEPTAAAVCFGADKVDDDDRHIYAVYDLGGGTFDVSIISVTKESVSVVGTGGNPQLGGGDFDDRITGHILQQIKAKHGVDLSQDPSVWQRIKREAEMRKRDLASIGATTLKLPFLTPQLSVDIPITRATFEALIDDLLKESLACLDRAIESAGKTKDISREDIEQVLLVGGSTRIPRVRAMLAEHLGKEEKDIRSDFSPDEVVARGAAMVARDCTPKDGYEGEEIVIPVDPTLVEERQAMILQDVTSHTLGILVNRSDFFPIIPKERNIPAEETQGGFTNGGRTREIPVLIFQGENPVAFDNTLIGRLPIDLPEEKEEGYYKFEVTFSLDRNGLLSVEIKCLNEELRDRTWKTDVQCNVRATKEQIDQSAQHLKEVMASGELAPAPGRKLTRLLDENVQFTVYRPKTVQPKKWYDMLAFAHLEERRAGAGQDEPDPIQEVKRQAEQVLGEQAAQFTPTTQDSKQAVPREGELTFVPDVPGVEFNPPRKSFFWREPVHREEFRLMASAELDGQVARGSLMVFHGSILLADATLSIKIDSSFVPKPATEQLEKESARRYRNIFASYSHDDAPIFKEVDGYVVATGDKYLQDVRELRAGQVWKDELKRYIKEADIFQLFWSWNSMYSEFVEQEWRYAMSLGRPYFIRPVYWEEELPVDKEKNLPPQELRDCVHFQRIHVHTRADAPPCGPNGGDGGVATGRPLHERFEAMARQLEPSKLPQEGLPLEGRIEERFSLDEAFATRAEEPARRAVYLVRRFTITSASIWAILIALAVTITLWAISGSWTNLNWVVLVTTVLISVVLWLVSFIRRRR